MLCKKIIVYAACFLCMALLISVGYNIIINFGSEPAQGTATRMTIEQVLALSLRYRQEHGGWPFSVERGTLCFFDGKEAVTNSSTCFPEWMTDGKPLADSWGKPFSVDTSGGRLTLVSAGADGITNTPDDITGWVLTTGGNNTNINIKGGLRK